MKLRLAIAVGSVVLMILAGCSASERARSGSSDQGGDEDRLVPSSQYEKTFNPSDYDDEIEMVQKQHQIEQERAGTEHQQDSLVVESEFAQGYRIQIYATSSIDEANAMRQTAVQRLPDDSIYVVFDPPVYKVRVGDFHSRNEANQRLGVVSALGFTDAWVVGDKIILRKLVRLPPPGDIRKR